MPRLCHGFVANLKVKIHATACIIAYYVDVLTSGRLNALLAISLPMLFNSFCIAVFYHKSMVIRQLFGFPDRWQLAAKYLLECIRELQWLGFLHLLVQRCGQQRGRHQVHEG